MRWNGASRCELVGKSMETETTTWSEFPNGGKAIVEQILTSEERNKSKRFYLSLKNHFKTDSGFKKKVMSKTASNVC